ncbi:MAG: hypothetical protein WEA61_09920 [Anaerolineales bacterium]
MGRVIHTENLVADRNRLLKAMAITLRELTKLAAFNAEVRDLAAFLVLALDNISESVERSVGPWEKRGYWLKADRFRMDWAWVDPLRRQLRQAVQSEDAVEVAQGVANLGEKLRGVEVVKRHRLGTPWVGAWKKMRGEGDGN